MAKKCYRVVFHEGVSYTIDVKADSPEQAEEYAGEVFDSGINEDYGSNSVECGSVTEIQEDEYNDRYEGDYGNGEEK